MPRPRKILAAQRGDLTVYRQERRAREEKLAKGAFDMVLDPPIELKDATARNKWIDVVKVKQETDTLSNAYFDNMVIYCNAWSTYMKAMRIQKRAGYDMKQLKRGMALEKAAVDLLYRYGARLGLDLNSRLKLASIKVDQEQDHVEQRFGVI